MNETEHADGCLTETTWDEDDCTCRCPICKGVLNAEGRCRWGSPCTDGARAL